MKRIARDVPAQVSGKQARHCIDGAAGFDPDNHPEGLAGVEVLRGGRLREACGGEHDHDGPADRLHRFLLG